MKNFFLILTFFMISILQAQNTLSGGDFTASGEASNFIRPGKNGYITNFYNKKRPTDGSFYLFDKWNNYCVIKTVDNQKFVLRNINLNMERNTFESKIEGDSIFTFNFNNIDKFVVNGRTFKNFYWNDDNKVYEIIFNCDKFQILKGFKVELVEGSANPMVNRTRDKYIRKEYYFLKKENELKSFKFKKKYILRLLSNNDDIDNIEAYAKQNNLSFKDEKDVNKILEYFVKI